MRYSYINALDTLTKWAIKEGYKNISLDYHDTSFIDWERKSLNEPKVIKIQHKYDYEHQTYLFLHEAGHHQIRKDWDDFKKKLPQAAFAEEKDTKTKTHKHKRRTSYVVSALEEEYLAWFYGLRLAKKLGIKINNSKWNALKNKCMMGYIRYYGSSQH